MIPEDRLLLFSSTPYSDESFIGYLLRLSQLNRYKTLSWILQLARIENYANGGFLFALKGSLDLSLLAQLSGADEKTLTSLLYAPVRVSERRMMGDYLVFGNTVSRHLIRLKTPKVCPACLREANYARKIWELAPVTTCPMHSCMLLDECPSCGKRIAWNRLGISLCRCKCDWREHNIALLDKSELEVARHIHLLCSLPAGSLTTDERRSSNPLFDLGLRQFISALTFVASQFIDIQKKGQRIIDTTGKNLAPSRRNPEIHALLLKALLVFDNWPNNYYSFLEDRRRQKESRNSTQQNYFGGYKSALFVQLAAPEFSFIRDAFRAFRRNFHYGHSIVKVNTTTKDEKAQKKQIPSAKLEPIETHVSGIKAKKALKTTWPGLKGLINAGKLKAIIVSKRRGRLFLVEKESLVELKERLEQSLFRKQVERTLGIHFARIKELIECGLLNPIRAPEVDGCGKWRFDHNEVEDLIDRLFKGLPRKRKIDKQKILSFKLVLRKLGRVGVSLGTFLQAVLDGEIKPCGRGREEDLRGLLFWEKQITSYVRSELRLLIGDALSLSETAKLLGVTKEAVGFLVKKGLLRAEKFDTVPSLGLLVKREDLNSFSETYLLAKEVASEHGTSSEFITDLFRGLGIRPVSGSRVDSGCIYLIRRNVVEALDLTALISEEKKKRAIVWKPPSHGSGPGSNGPVKKSESIHLLTKASQWWILDERQAAEVLEIDVKTVRELAERGILKPHKRLSRDIRKGRKYYFSRYVVQKYMARSADHTGLIAYMAAAKLFELWPDNFYNKFVKTGRLKPVIAGDRRSDYLFRVADVESLLELERQTIITPEAAEILHVNVSCIEKMVASGALKPISGPNVDGFGKNLFLRGDVKRLHSEREAFKAERVNDGKTNRFGRYSSHRARPVRDVIGPRIEKLLEEWGKKCPGQYISGYRLYRQLISEGYQLGIVTIYMYLREKRYQAA
jgi:TniQ/Helix-turn-helix domain